MSKLLFAERSRSFMFCSPFDFLYVFLNNSIDICSSWFSSTRLGRWNGEAWGTWWLPNQLHGPCSGPSNGYRLARNPTKTTSDFNASDSCRFVIFSFKSERSIVDCWPKSGIDVFRGAKTLMDRCRWHLKENSWYYLQTALLSPGLSTKTSIAIGSLASRIFNHYHHQLQNVDS